VRHSLVSSALRVPPASLHALDRYDSVRVIGEDDLEPAGFCRGDLHPAKLGSSLAITRSHFRMGACIPQRGSGPSTGMVIVPSGAVIAMGFTLG
jgi:hypothetical protein